MAPTLTSLQDLEAEAHELGHALRRAWEVESIDSAKLVRNEIQIESF